MCRSVASIANKFAIGGEFLKAEEINNGLINSTFCATFKEPNNSLKRYIFQRINETVFPSAKEVMQNVERVTHHINKTKVTCATTNKTNQQLTLVPTKNGKFFAEEAPQATWRCYHFIEGCTTYDECLDEKIAYESSRAFGVFLDLVSDIPADTLHETIKDFHHTAKRYNRLMEIIKLDPKGRVSKVLKEINFIRQREADCHRLIAMMESGELPVRVTHNDAKINNVMIDEELTTATCVIDLDTVMPGLAAYDFGDLVRTAASGHEEDTIDLTSVKVRPTFFKALAKGYIDGCQTLTKKEVQTLTLGGKLMTLEVGIRFLTDYLEGDVYFKTSKSKHNLVRCRTQLKLVEELEKHDVEFNTFISSLVP